MINMCCMCSHSKKNVTKKKLRSEEPGKYRLKFLHHFLFTIHGLCQIDIYQSGIDYILSASLV